MARQAVSASGARDRHDAEASPAVRHVTGVDEQWSGTECSSGGQDERVKRLRASTERMERATCGPAEGVGGAGSLAARWPWGRVDRAVGEGTADSAPGAEDTAASAAHLGACVGARRGPCPRGGAVYRIVCRRAVSISREKIEKSNISMKYLLEACERAKFSRAGARPPLAPRTEPGAALGATWSWRRRARAKSRRF